MEKWICACAGMTVKPVVSTIDGREKPVGEHLLISTRKGLFILDGTPDGWRIARREFLGDNVALALADARDGSWYAVLDLGHFGNKLQVSRDRGHTWTESTVPAFGADDEVITGDGKLPQRATLRLVWSLEAGSANQPGRLWA